MSPPVLSNKYCSVDAIHKIGSFPIPREGRLVPTMNKLTTRELNGAIIFRDKSKPHDKYLGFLLDKILSDGTTVDIPSFDMLTVPRSTIGKYNPQIVQRYPSDVNIPLYDTSAKQWNWPLTRPATPPLGTVSDPATPSPAKKFPSQESLVAAFFNAIALATGHKTAGQDSQRYWLSSYSTRRMPGTVEGAGAFHRKPDLILVEKSDALTDCISWMSPKVLAECTNQAWKPSIPLVKTLHTKAYLVLLDQPWRRFVLAVSIMKQDIRVHFYDRSGCSVSPAFNIHSNPHIFVTILVAIMFESRVCIGFDPTITVRPVQPLRAPRRKVVYDSDHIAIPESIPEELEHSTSPLESLPTPESRSDSHFVDFIAPPPFPHAHPTPQLVDSTCQISPSDTPNPIGEIRVHDVTYQILEILFSSGGFLGRGTVIYLVEREGKQYIIKDHWVENPHHEATMMTRVEGIRGIPQLVDSWVVEIRPGVVDITSRYCSEECQLSMKVIRTHVHKVTSPHGRPLTKFRTKRELIQCIRDILIGEYIPPLVEFHG